MKNISQIEAFIIGMVVGGLLSHFTKWLPFTNWQWWVAFVLAFIPVSQLYAHLRDWVKKPRPVYQDDIQDNLGRDEEE